MIDDLFISLVLKYLMYSIFPFELVNNYTKQLKFILLKIIGYGILM